MTANKRVLIPIADGSEDIETVAIIDVLRRAQLDVTVASVMPDLQVKAARGTSIVADAMLEDCAQQHFDAIALPGGIPGANHLRDSSRLIQMLQTQLTTGDFIAAICASPAVVFAHHGLSKGRKSTSHPGFVQFLEHAVNERVVIDGNCITSQGPGTAIEFALAIVACLQNKTSALKVAEPMVLSSEILHWLSNIETRSITQ